MEEQKEFKEENLEEDIKEVEMATKKGCAKQGKNPPKTKGEKCGTKRKKSGYAKAKSGLKKLKKYRP